MRVIPVLDLMDGVVVRGIGGERDGYRPIVSRLTSSAEPLDVAGAIRDEFGISEFYVADLDAIMRDAPHWDVMRDLSRSGFRLMVDAGLRDLTRGEQMLECGAMQIIAALETSTGPGHVRELVERLGADRVIFSLDLREGKSLGNAAEWSSDPGEVAAAAYDCGVRSMIVLDLAGVGRAAGVRTMGLCRQLMGEYDDLKIITGGGVRSREDLDAVRREGVDGVLVASAIHNGQLMPSDLSPLAPG